MHSIVMNTLNAAVTEHDLQVTSISASYAGSDAGLYAIGGTAPVDARATLPITDRGSNKRKSQGNVLFDVQGPAGSSGVLLVQTMTTDDQDVEVIEEFEYPFELRAGHVSRGKPGRGIRANRLGIGYANLDGAAFRLKGLEDEPDESKTRRLT